MPQPIIHVPKQVKPATFESVKRAGAVGDAQFQYFVKYGKLPTNRDQLQEFLSK